MKIGTLRISLIVAVVSGMLAAGAAHADTQTVTVKAVVIGICKFNTGQTPVVTVANSGSNIDPSLAGPASGNVNVLYKCTKGQVPVFTGPATATAACTTAATCGVTSMAPAMTYTSGGNGVGFSSAGINMVVNGQLTQAQYQDMQAGTYSGTVTVTVTP